MSTTTLERVHTGNPFSEHPQLRTIWDRDWSGHVEADTVDDLSKGENDAARNRVLLVRDEQWQVVGITGFYLLPRRLIGLRWHGVIPERRGLGYSKQAFQQVCKLAKDTTNALGVAEYVEMSDPKAESLIAHFIALGFTVPCKPKDCSEFPAEATLPPGSGRWLELLFNLHPTRMVGKFVF